MKLDQLDFAFPFVVFFAGALMVFLIDGPWSKYIAIAIRRRGNRLGHGQRQQLQKWQNDFESKRMIAYVLLVVGALWSLQNLWFGSISSLPKF